MAEASSTQGKPVVLIIGGLGTTSLFWRHQLNHVGNTDCSMIGYIGRHLAHHIHTNGLAAEIRLVDKVLPQLARLPPEFSESCSPSKFMQADASKPQFLDRIFTFASQRPPDYVFNCGGETRYSQEASVYDLRSTQLTKNLATHCASLSPAPVLVEFSTGMVYKPPGSSTISSGGCKEDAPLKPWLKVAKAKLEAEEVVAALARKGKLNYVTLRLAHVYGPYDVGFLSRGLCLARVYQSQGKPMKWLWGSGLRINTVHVQDVCSVAWAAALWARKNPPHASSSAEDLLTDRAFNVVDSGDTSQQTLADLFKPIFGIETGFQNTLISQFAKLNLDHVVDDVNDEILQPWADLLKEKGLGEGQGSPLSPFMEKELLKDSDLSLNGAKAATTLGWKLQKPELTGKEVEAILESYRSLGWWP